MTAVLNPSSTRPNAARRPAPPAPTTTASYWWSTTGYCLEIASVLTLAESWPETVKLKFLAALAWSCGPLFSSPVIRGIPAILFLGVLCKYPAFHVSVEIHFLSQKRQKSRYVEENFNSLS